MIAKAAGISALMLGLAGIGALAMAQGLTPRQTIEEGGPGPRAHAVVAPAHAGAAPPAHAGAVLAVAAGPAVAGGMAGAPNSADSPAPSASATADETRPASGMTADGRVILNQATIDDLRHLPGIGQKRAEAILQLRQKLGRFRRVTDLLRVKGIGPKRLKQLAPKMVLDAEARAGGEGRSPGGMGPTETGGGTATGTGTNTGAGS